MDVKAFVPYKPTLDKTNKGRVFHRVEQIRHFLVVNPEATVQDVYNWMGNELSGVSFDTVKTDISIHNLRTKNPTKSNVAETLKQYVK